MVLSSKVRVSSCPSPTCGSGVRLSELPREPLAHLCQRELSKIFPVRLLARRRRCGNARGWKPLDPGCSNVCGCRWCPLSGHRDLRTLNTSLPPQLSTGVHEVRAKTMTSAPVSFGLETSLQFIQRPISSQERADAEICGVCLGGATLL